MHARNGSRRRTRFLSRAVVLPGVLLMAIPGAVGAVAADATTQLDDREGVARDVRVVHGRDPGSAELGFVVFVTDRATRSWTCGGALVTPTLVLTAAHCVVGGDAPGTAARMLVQSAVDRFAPNARTVGVSSARIHPDYDPVTQRADLAVLRLERAFTGVGTASIATPQQASTTLSAGSPVTSAGWGKRSDSDTTGPRLMQVADMVAFPDASCGGGQRYQVGRRAFWPATAPADPAIHVCAAGVTTEGAQVGMCNGDSGGPLVTGAGAAARIVGVVAFGTRETPDGPMCEIWRPLVFTRTTAYQGWLTAQGVPVDKAATTSAPLPPIDRTRPKVATVSTRVRPGAKATLRYRVWEATKATREQVLVRTYTGKVVVKKATAMAAAPWGGWQSVTVRIPRGYRGGDYCVQARDRAGNYSTYSCSRLLLRR
ncbi:MAG: serine protease [Candidatus Nanopelagicales bacterium]